MAPEFSFIVNSCDDRRFRFFEACFLGRLAGAHYEVIRISDAHSMAEGYNRGAASARADWLLFCHDDVAILSDNPLDALREAMDKTDLFGVCGTCRLTSANWYDSGFPYTFGAVVAPLSNRPWRRELQIFGMAPQRLVLGGEAMDGIFIGCHRSVFEALNGFDSDHFKSFMGYDIDFSFRGCQHGARVGIQTGLLLLHLSAVPAFSMKKMQEWKLAMQLLTDLHGARFSSAPGKRGHRAFPINGYDPAMAAAILERLRHSAVSQPRV